MPTAAELLALYGPGMTYAELAERTGISRTRIGTMIRRARVERARLIYESRAAGETVAQLGERFGLSVSAVSEIEHGELYRRSRVRESQARRPTPAHPVIRLAVILQTVRRSEIGRALGCLNEAG